MIYLRKRALSVLIAISMSLPLTAFAEKNGQFTVKIVHTNDIHARVQENEKNGIIGMEKLGSIIDSFTDNSDMNLVLDSGDLFHGQPIATISRGESIAQLVKACGYDAMTVGNHDWNYGKDRLSELCEMSDIAMLAGNVLDSETGKCFFGQEFYTKSVEINGNELKIGLFGVMDPKIKTMTAPSNIEGLTFADPVEYANKAAQELKNQNCDIVIALTHTYGPEAIAEKVSGVDLWLAGHEHVYINSDVTDNAGKTTHVVEDGYYFSALSLIELTGNIDAEGKTENIKITVSPKKYKDVSDYAVKESVAAVMEEITAKQAETLDVKVGETPENLDGVWEDLRIFQQNAGNAVTDAYLLETGADVAFENAGGIRASVEKGDVTYGDIIGISPYGNYIVTKEISGKALKEILELALEIQSQCIAANDSGEYDSWPQSSGSYLQFGGMTVVYAPDKEEGSRVLSVTVKDEPLDLDKKYLVATNNFVAESSYYTQLAEAEELGQFSACEEALIKFFRQPADIISKSVCTQRLFAVHENGAALISASPTESTVYASGNINAYIFAAEYDADGALISITSKLCPLVTGMNRVNTDFTASSEDASPKFYLFEMPFVEQ